MTFAPTNNKALNSLRRMKDQASYDHESVYSVLDKGLVAHVGFTLPSSLSGSEHLEEWPGVIPMVYGRINNTIYLHGYVSGRLMKALAVGTENGEVGLTKAAITVTLVDGLVIACSPFNHSMNYRSVCVFGYPELVVDQEEKEAGLRAITDHAFKANRWGTTRETNKTEYLTTKVIKVEIEAASVKKRTGQVTDDEEDKGNESHFAGILPLETKWGNVEPVDYNVAPIPEYLKKMEGADAQ
ncbi:UNVERIFIED_CONTAM: hypothetical protein HDU68_002349 [Siphonaria sp. JEL0065]|nr:hypothetical protein HDU68_002349 [Siphonaria sp. JEL0065]